MVVSVAILQGYQETIEGKVYGFDAHVHVQSYQASSQTEPLPIRQDLGSERKWRKLPLIAHVQPFGLKPALLKTKTAVQGILIKGYNQDWDTATFRQHLVAGRMPIVASQQILALAPDTECHQVLISSKLATLLELKVGDDVVLYFLQNPPRFRKVVITGLYETSLEEFDTQFVIGDLAMLRNLSGWGDTLVSGYQVMAKDPKSAPQVAEQINQEADYKLLAQPITAIHPQLFDWLQLISRNVEVLIVLITLVACFNMCSTLLIMILERTKMIGVLKALGASNYHLAGIFFYTGMGMILRSVLWGNLVGLGLCWVQYQFRFVPLDAANYYIAYVPIAWNWSGVLILNLVVLAASALALLLPGLAVGSVRVSKALRFA